VYEEREGHIHSISNVSNELKKAIEYIEEANVSEKQYIHTINECVKARDEALGEVKKVIYVHE